MFLDDYTPYVCVHRAYWNVDQVFRSALSLFITTFTVGCSFWAMNARKNKVEHLIILMYNDESHNNGIKHESL